MYVLRAYLDAFGRRGVGIVKVIGVAGIVVVLGGAVAVVEAAGGDDAYLAAVDVSLPVGFQTLAAAAAGLQVDLAVVDGEDRVAGDTCRSLRLKVFRVPLAVAGAYHRDATTIDIDVGIAVDALCTRGRYLDIEDAAVDVEVVAGLDAVIGRGADIHVDAFVEHDVALAVNAVVVGAVDGERARAAEDHLALGEDGSLMAVVGAGAVGKLVGAGKDYEGLVLALYVKSHTAGAGDGGIVEVEEEVGLAVDGQRTVAGGARHYVLHTRCAAVTGCNVVAIDRDGDTVLLFCLRIGHVDIDDGLKGVFADVVGGLGIGGGGGCGGLCRCLVDIDGERQ